MNTTRNAFAMLLWYWLCLAVGPSAFVSAVDNPEDFVQPLAGSFTGHGGSFSTGNTLPMIARPWGFNHFSIHNEKNWKTAWWFNGNLHQFRWLRITHQPSPWIGDWNWLVFGPQMGSRTKDPVMFWEPRAAKIKPYELDATLAPDLMRLQLTPSEHGAVLKTTFPERSDIDKRVCFYFGGGKRGGIASRSGETFGENNTPFFKMEADKRPNGVPANYKLHVRVEASLKGLKAPDSVQVEIELDMTCMKFDRSETATTLYIGTSFIDHEQAEINLRTQVRDRSYEDVREESRTVWNEKLGRIDVIDPGPLTGAVVRRLEIFYTGLYRGLLFPRRIDEPKSGNPSSRYHRSPYDRRGGIYDGPLCTDNGFWDTFRTVYTLINMAYREDAAQILNGWLNAFKEGGWLPQWSSPTYTASMVGTYASVVVADGILKNTRGVNGQTAAQAMIKDSTGGEGNKGKSFYSEYNRNAFVGYQKTKDAVSVTLDFGYSDYSVALALDKISASTGTDYSSQSKMLRERGLKARNSLFDSGSGFFRPKQSTGAWVSGWSANTWGNGYVEGNAWHHSFPAYDLQGLAGLHGSRKNLARKIQSMLKAPGVFGVGSYRQEIHEMTESRALAMGQYGHNNQPSHHILHLLAALDDGDDKCKSLSKTEELCSWDGMEKGAPLKSESNWFSTSSQTSSLMCPRRMGEAAIHHVLQNAYGRDFYAGDEDNGEMGAWFVLSAIGLFDPAPGTAYGYSLGSPLFRKIKIKTGFSESSQSSLLIESRRAGSDDVRHVHSVLQDGKDISSYATDGIGYTGLGWRISHEDLVLKGSTTLRFLTGGEIEDEPDPLNNAASVTANDDEVNDLKKQIYDLKRKAASVTVNDDEVSDLRKQISDLQQEMATDNNDEVDELKKQNYDLSSMNYMLKDELERLKKKRETSEETKSTQSEDENIDLPETHTEAKSATNPGTINFDQFEFLVEDNLMSEVPIIVPCIIIFLLLLRYICIRIKWRRFMRASSEGDIPIVMEKASRKKMAWCKKYCPQFFVSKDS